MGKHRRVTWYWCLLGAILTLSAVLNLCSWSSTTFSDWYVQHIFPLWSETISRVTGLFSFSVGEGMLVIGAIWIVAAVVGLLVLAIRRFAGRREFRNRKTAGRVRFFYQATAMVLSMVLLVMTLNCFILYHATGMPSENFTEEEKAVFYSKEQLALLRDFVVTKANEMAYSVERDAEGNVIFKDELAAEAIQSMQKLALVNPQLQGFYPSPKGMGFSDLMSQSYMQGYYFPFSMEANYNTTMKDMNKPFTMCHELSHLKGYIKEDDANMLAFLACIGSDDPAFVYSGYLGVLNYVNNDFYQSIGKNNEVYLSHVEISPLVKEDSAFLSDDAWKKVEEKAVVTTKTMTMVSHTFTDSTLKANGVKEGSLSYNQVVQKLLEYYLTEEPLGTT